MKAALLLDTLNASTRGLARPKWPANGARIGPKGNIKVVPRFGKT
jgi:hypothetical protein